MTRGQARAGSRWVRTRPRGRVVALPSAAAHSSQTGSTPAEGAVLDVPPSLVEVTFDTPLMDMGAALVVRSEDGTVISDAAPEVDRTAIRIAVAADAPPGAYTVAYRVVSQDGHAITSTFDYTVAGDSAGPGGSSAGTRGGSRGTPLCAHRGRPAGPDPDRGGSDSLAVMTTTEHATTPELWPAPTASEPIDAVVAVPGSKSASNRALILAAIADGPSTITGLLDARDTQLMMAGLRLLGQRGARRGPRRGRQRHRARSRPTSCAAPRPSTSGSPAPSCASCRRWPHSPTARSRSTATRTPDDDRWPP